MQILLTVAYDGTNFAGWQRQENALAVQEVLENALAELLGREVVLRGASRTDAGVHALGQRAAFFCEEMRIPLEKLPQVLEAHLPAEISVVSAEEVAEDFNPRFHARRKTYVYKFYNAPTANPLVARYAAHVPQTLDIAAMKKAAECFIGRHDFAAFCATGGSAKTTVREIFSCAIEQDGHMVSLKITGGGFLYNMVRIIAGTVLYAGLGKISAGGIPDIIAAKDRKNAGKTMPAHGLTLVEVEYFTSTPPP